MGTDFQTPNVHVKAYMRDEVAQPTLLERGTESLHRIGSALFEELVVTPVTQVASVARQVSSLINLQR